MQQLNTRSVVDAKSKIQRGDTRVRFAERWMCVECHLHLFPESTEATVEGSGVFQNGQFRLSRCSPGKQANTGPNFNYQPGSGKNCDR